MADMHQVAPRHGHAVEHLILAVAKVLDASLALELAISRQHVD
jgi:hypothetical protein